ncbi:MAG: hypothetical protein BRC46_04735 [Cyanobacteria bacterium QS_6_48_18]|nr:MAG: hypothetical protein BRC46_04735 [Cyanobacteria bacterium QS_6_48_18]
MGRSSQDSTQRKSYRAFLGIAHPYLELILYITGLPKGRGLRPMIFGSKTTVARRCTGSVPQKRIKENTTQENSYGYALATTQNPYRKVTTDAGE